jgi:hypothetical protein
MGANKKRFRKGDPMNELSHCRSMASICRARAFEDKERRVEWLAWAEEWNHVAVPSISHPFKEEGANLGLVSYP